MEHQSRTDATPGLFAGLAGLTRNTFALLVSRIELAALELSEVRTNLLRILLVYALAIVAAWFAIAWGTVLLVYLTWATLGWKILLIVTAAFALAAFMIFRHAQTMLADGKLSMPATMAELRNDRNALL